MVAPHPAGPMIVPALRINSADEIVSVTTRDRPDIAAPKTLNEPRSRRTNPFDAPTYCTPRSRCPASADAGAIWSMSSVALARKTDCGIDPRDLLRRSVQQVAVGVALPQRGRARDVQLAGEAHPPA